jgi:sec-independent protein translocase protein TatB
MFDIGWSELVVIGVVALIAIGPKELPGVLRSVGHWMGKIRRMAAEFQGQFQEAMREAEMSDLKKHADDLNNAAKQLTSDFTNPYDAFKDTPKDTEAPKPASEAGASQPLSLEPTAGDVKPETPVPDYGQVAAMPETPLEAKPPQPAVAEPPPPEPVRREA